MQQEICGKHVNDANGNPAGGNTYATGMMIRWQNGPLGRGEDRRQPNGCFVETVIAAAIDRLSYYQESDFACDENANAMESLESALAFCRNRTARREVAGVEGLHSGN